MGECSFPPGMLCGRSNTYPASQRTSGTERTSQNVIAVDGVCTHLRLPGPGELGLATVGLVVGVVPGAGNSSGWCRVETMVVVRMLSYLNRKQQLRDQNREGSNINTVA